MSLPPEIESKPEKERTTPQQLFAFLDQLGIPHKTVAHPPLYTVEQAREWNDKIDGLPCKNLFLKDKKDKLWLVVMPAEKRADLGKIKERVGTAPLSFGKPELLLEVLGLTPGAVNPFAVLNDAAKRVTMVLDSDMMQSEWVNYHPLHNEASTTIRSADLLKFLQALDYQPLIVDCG